MNTSTTPKPPTRLANRFVRYVMGFGVGVVVGMAPFFGKIGVPGFTAIPELFPSELRDSVVPFAGFLMGVIAVVVQFHSGESIPKTTLRRRFRRSLQALLAGVFLLLIQYTFFVVRTQSVPIMVTWSRLEACPCETEMSDLQCIEEISVDPKWIELCWGGKSRGLIRLSLSASYLLTTCGFGALIGLLLLQEVGSESPQRRKRRGKGKPDT